MGDSHSLFGGTIDNKKSAAIQSRLTATGAEAESTASTLLPYMENTVELCFEQEKNKCKNTADRIAFVGRDMMKGTRETLLSSVAAAT